jgi:AraC-like DNA-binding protein
LLKRGKPLKVVAPAVGYTNATAFSRVFTKRTGVSPAQWMARSEAAL